MKSLLDTFVAADLTILAKAFFATFFILGMAGILGGVSALFAYLLGVLPKETKR